MSTYLIRIFCFCCAHGEKISKISLFVLAQLTNVTDRRTDGQTPRAGNSRKYTAALLLTTVYSQRQ